MAIQEISVDELETLLISGARLIDVREPAEFEESRVAQATSIPLGTVPEHLDAFRGEGPAYVICRTGGRSSRVCEFLAGYGIEAINVAGGTMAWMMSGRDVATGVA